MSKKYKKIVKIEKMEQIGAGIFSIWLEDREITFEATAGQFVSLYCRDGSRLLPRPISICEIDKEKGMVRLVFRVAGKGTEEFAKMKPGDFIDVMGPLGNGFTLEGTKAILIGGGIGIPPMLELAKELSCEKQIVLGYRDSDTFLKEEFEPYGTVYVATEDGSIGTKGNVIDAIKGNDLNADIIFACGPAPMLRGVKEYAISHEIKAQISMEERMACGIGACLACVCGKKEKDHHTNVKNTRICKDGPVFYIDDIEL
ncbi:dihydroorotate dehydrogenase electron transfer subunit [Velocimicrobium porci]|uniref:Dihydroorotate dehydrogenase B (NAD(+)), electron transfer subunit n=1 Tax=Velocimicrobium porci TaxID=2606634 RepID=A0A6L5Y088_9FIRM|nr:dihydroorotate dehydrogenase electron transfer subunit [Velocimicrobium porci]MSS64247.1 dihydroorotate dehydrogenase electron transfer subunit [Velocimicrobium porci]